MAARDRNPSGAHGGGAQQVEVTKERTAVPIESHRVHEQAVPAQPEPSQPRDPNVPAQPAPVQPAQ